MSQEKHSDVPLPIAEELRRDLIVQFLAELLRITGTPDNQEDFHTALQTYCDGLHLWLEPGDGPPNPRAVFSLLEDYTLG